jgi:hypothetical protein
METFTLTVWLYFAGPPVHTPNLSKADCEVRAAEVAPTNGRAWCNGPYKPGRSRECADCGTPRGLPKGPNRPA